ncbi:hypothetical protein Q9L58_004092 [Maublancomyces gigas]|uniref:Uncharacterized protein n=1 Tax=Discina gigas TaxID=1032678 RepID=A0ABR3GLT3_9PEZI
MPPRKDSETLPPSFLLDLARREESAPQHVISTSPTRIKKPKIAAVSPSADLLSRLNAFLPEISAANRELESEIAAGTIGARNIENVDGSKDEAYIEMNLGLGVLKELKPRQPGDPESSESESEGEEGEESEEGEEGDILAKLLNGNKRYGKGLRGRPSIQEVEETVDTPMTGDVEMDVEKSPKEV